MTGTADYYLRDLGFLLREDWADAERSYEVADPDQKLFEDGRRRAYCEVLTLMLSQAIAFDLPPSAICLDGLDADKDLGF